MLDRITATFSGILRSSAMPSPRPELDDHFESNVTGLYVIGDLAGAPVVKLAMEQGYRLAHELAGKIGPAGDPDAFDVLVVGAGAAGLNCALEAQALGLRVLVIEKDDIGSTVAGLPEGKWIYAEPAERPVKGRLTLQEMTKEQLVERWREDVRRDALPVRTGEAVEAIRRSGQHFEVATTRGAHRARAVVLASGKSGSPRKLGVPGEDLPQVHHKLWNPKLYSGEPVVVVGGGNSAVEAAIALAEQNFVTLVYRGSDFSRVTKENRRKLDQAMLQGGVEVRFSSTVVSFDLDAYTLHKGERRPYTQAFVLIGAETPTGFLHSLGLRLENDWRGSPIGAILGVVAVLVNLSLFRGQTEGTPLVAAAFAALAAGVMIWRAMRGDRYELFGLTFLLAYTIYGAKQATGHEFWPFTGWGFKALSLFDRPWSFWYTVLYTGAMTVFGIQAMKRWGWDRKDKFQIWRYASLIGFQWVFFFLIPEVLFRSAVENQWVGAEMAKDPNFANNAWRSYGIVYAWPLFFYTFFGAPHQVWIVWGLVLSFVLIPLLVLFHGKRYCSWICGCGGLAETVGDRWRHLSPKGAASIRWERMNAVVLAAAVAITVMIVSRDAIAVFRKPSQSSLELYHLVADVWLVGIVPITLYPFLGGKIWCRYWCPLAKMMEMFSWLFTRFRASRFAIQSNEKCIACGECTRNCQVGIDVMRFALKQEELTNYNSSCIGCGICVTVCPMNVLSFGKPGGQEQLVQISRAA